MSAESELAWNVDVASTPTRMDAGQRTRPPAPAARNPGTHVTGRTAHRDRRPRAAPALGGLRPRRPADHRRRRQPRTTARPPQRHHAKQVRRRRDAGQPRTRLRRPAPPSCCTARHPRNQKHQKQYRGQANQSRLTNTNGRCRVPCGPASLDIRAPGRKCLRQPLPSAFRRLPTIRRHRLGQPSYMDTPAISRASATKRNH